MSTPISAWVCALQWLVDSGLDRELLDGDVQRLTAAVDRFLLSAVDPALTLDTLRDKTRANMVAPLTGEGLQGRANRT